MSGGYCNECGVFMDDGDSRKCFACGGPDARIAALESRLAAMTKDRDDQAEAVRNAGCFFCRDCDAVRCKAEITSNLRKIAAQSGKRNWWNVVIYVIELHRMVLDEMRRAMNNPIAAAAKDAAQ